MSGWTLSTIGSPESPTHAAQIDEELLRIACGRPLYPSVCPQLGEESEFLRLVRVGSAAASVVCDARKLLRRLRQIPEGAPAGSYEDAPRGSVWGVLLVLAIEDRTIVAGR